MPGVAPTLPAATAGPAGGGGGAGGAGGAGGDLANGLPTQSEAASSSDLPAPFGLAEAQILGVAEAQILGLALALGAALIALLRPFGTPRQIGAARGRVSAALRRPVAGKAGTDQDVASDRGGADDVE